VTAAPLGFVPTASAATLTATMIKMLHAPLITYADRQTTFGGTLDTRASATDPGQGIAGEPVDLTLATPDGTTVEADLGTVQTAADGSFSLTTTLPFPGTVFATFAGDTTYAATIGRTLAQASAFLPTHVLLDPLATQVAPGTNFTISGQVQVQTPDGSWVAAPGSLVSLWKGIGSTNPHYADADGRFSFPVTASYPANWQIRVEQGYSFAKSALSASVFVDLPPEQTKITSFAVKAVDGAAQDGLAFSGHADVLVSGQWKPYSGPVQLYFQPKGSTTWTLFDTVGTDINGKVALTETIAPYLRLPATDKNQFDSLIAEDGSWQLRIPQTSGSQGRVGMLGSSSSAVPTATLRWKTKFNGDTVKKSGQSRFLVGNLWEPIWNDGSSFGYIGMVPKQPIKLYYRYRTGKVWHYAGTTSTNGDGVFSIKLTGTKRYYKVVYSGSSRYLGTTSPSIYFSS
jgi:hypothetical protein